MMDPYAYGTVQVTASLGLALFVAGVAYRALPLNLIPNFLPIVGHLDDALAGAVAVAGVALMYIGWQYGTGPKPTEMVIVAEMVSRVWDLLRPLIRVALVAARALVAAASAVRGGGGASRARRDRGGRDGDVENGGCIRGAGVVEYLGKVAAEYPAMFHRW